MDGFRERGLVDTEGRFTDAGRETKQRIEALTDELAAAPCSVASRARGRPLRGSSNPANGGRERAARILTLIVDGLRATG